MKRVSCFALLAALVCGSTGLAQDQVGVWMKYEKPFESDKSYENPLYDVKEFAMRFTSPTGRVRKIDPRLLGRRTRLEGALLPG